MQLEQTRERMRTAPRVILILKQGSLKARLHKFLAPKMPTTKHQLEIKMQLRNVHFLDHFLLVVVSKNTAHFRGKCALKALKPLSKKFWMAMTV